MDRHMRNRLRIAAESGSQEDLAALGAAFLRAQGRPEGEHEPCQACANRTEPEADYRASVRAIVDDIREGIGPDGHLMSSDEVQDFIWESVGGSEWVIYANRARQALAVSDNDGYAAEHWGPEGLFENGQIQWDRLAFGALYGDVQDLLYDEIDANEPFTCSKCFETHEHRTAAVECCMDDDLVEARWVGYDRAEEESEEEMLDFERQTWDR